MNEVMTEIELNPNEFDILNDIESIDIHSVGFNKRRKSVRNLYVLIENGRYVYPFNRIWLYYTKYGGRYNNIHIKFFSYNNQVPLTSYYLSQLEIIQLMREITLREIT